MVEAADGAGFAMEANAASGVWAEEDLEGDDTIEASVASFVDFAHAARAHRSEGFVGPQTRSFSQSHGFWSL
jgi:hypothetical protein